MSVRSTVKTLLTSLPTNLLTFKKTAFTLAEVLVTLGIIGVVSAVTIPTLLKNHQRQVYVTQLHKVYNEFSQALDLYLTERNAINLTEAGITSTATFDAFLRDHFKIVKECSDTMNGCFASSYTTISGTTAEGTYTRNITSFVLANGASVRPWFVREENGDKLVSMGVDINGQQGPNVAGRDFFFFYIYNNALIDDLGNSAPLTTAQRENDYTTYCLSGTAGCFGKILNDNWQMTY